MNLDNRPGDRGATLITNTTSYNGTWAAIMIVTDAVFTTLTSPSLTVNGSIAGLTFPKGALIFGDFRTIQLASGAVLAYHAS
jgi:hypothetical protein